MVTHWLRESFLLAQGFPKVLGSIYSPGGFADLSATLKYGTGLSRSGNAYPPTCPINLPI